MASPELILQPTRHPLDDRPQPITLLLRRSHRNRRLVLPLHIRNQYHVPQPLAVGLNVLTVVAGIHQFVTRRHPLRRHGGQRDRDLRVVRGGGSDHATERNLAVAHVPVQLVPLPPILAPIPAHLASPVTGGRQFRQHFRYLHLRLPLQPRLGRWRLVLARPAPVPFGWRGPLLALRLLPHRNRARIPDHVPDQVVLIYLRHQLLLHLLQFPTVGHLGEGPRAHRLARHLAPPLPPTQPPQRGIRLQPVQQLSRGAQIQSTLGQKGAQDRQPVRPRTAPPSAPPVLYPLQFQQTESRGQQLTRFAQRTQFLFQKRKQGP